MSAVESPRNVNRISVPPPTVASAGARSTMGAPPAARTPPATPPSPPVPLPEIRIGEDSFVSEAMVDGWVRAGAAVRAGACLTSRDGQRFLLRDAVRVLGRRNGDTDPYGFTGRVEALRELVRRGASISADALRLGPAVYDVEFGYVAVAMEAAARVV